MNNYLKDYLLPEVSGSNFSLPDVVPLLRGLKQSLSFRLLRDFSSLCLCFDLEDFSDLPPDSCDLLDLDCTLS